MSCEMKSKKINEGEKKSNKDILTLFILAEEQRSLATLLLYVVGNLAVETAAMGKSIQLEKKNCRWILMQYLKFTR